MRKVTKVLPVTIRSIVIGRLALCGLPFLAGYYSKDLILEASQTTITKRVTILISMVATLMTAMYRIRLLFFLIKPLTTAKVIQPISEENYKLKKSILRLTSGVFLSGWIITISLVKTCPIVIPFLKKITPLIMLIFATFYVLGKKKSFSSQRVIKFLSNNWFYVKIMHKKSLALMAHKRITGVLRSLDQGWTSLLGVSKISAKVISLSKKMIPIHRSNIVNYLKFTILIRIIIWFGIYK